MPTRCEDRPAFSAVRDSVIMMTAQEHDVAILFADVCDSTPLYEETGNFEALGLISHCIDGLAEITAAKRGRIIRSKGDDLLCTFADAEDALCAATSMVEEQASGPLSIHVGMNYGPVIDARGEVFGNAVNLAARLLSLAKPGEILTTSEFVDRLAPAEREAMTPIGERLVKGKHQPIAIFSAVLGEGESTTFAAASAEPEPSASEPDAAPVCLEVEFAGETLVLREDQPGLLIGRANRCGLVVNASCVSREHATIRVRNRQVVLTDHSSTGTYVTGRGERAIRLRRDSVQLVGSGTISLGLRPRGEGVTPTIQFCRALSRRDDAS